MAGETFGARPIITVGGSPLRRELEPRVRRVTVTSDGRDPDACRIVLDDPTRTALADAGIDLHAELEVKAGRTGENSEQPLFTGRVYGLGFDFDDRGATSVVIAYDHSYALREGLRTATYRDVTDADLARRLAGEAGLQAGRIEATSVVHEHLSQFNETHWDFLTRRGREIGYDVRVIGKQLDFTPSHPATEAPAPGDFQATDRLQLTPGGNLEQFTARITAAQQVAEVQVRGWDPKAKRELVATEPARTRATELARGLGAPQNGQARHVTTTLPLATQAEVDATAKAEAERLASSGVHAEGIAKGDPRLLAGAAVSVGQTGGRFDGKYTISQAKHVFGPTGYRTHFTVGGQHDRASVLGLATGGGGGAASRGPAGPVVGVVTNVTDPEHRGRVKLKLPWLADDYESNWARVVQHGAAADRGLLVLPEVNDEVLVAFEHGDTRMPYVLGGLFNGSDTPPFSGGVDGGSGKVVTRGLRSRKGHEVTVNDNDGAETIELKTSGGTVRVTLDHTGKKLVVESGGDVEVHATGSATVKADRDVTVEAGGSGKFTARQGLTLESSGQVSIKGSVIKLN